MPVAYKLTLLLKRQPELPLEEFSRSWLELERAKPLISPGLVQYVFNRALPGGSPIAGAAASPYDGVVETWWTRKNDAADWAVSRGFEESWLAPRFGLLAERPAAVGGAPQLIWELEQTEAMTPVTAIVLPVARRSLRFDEFVEHWTSSHAALALGGPGTKDRVIRLEDTPAPIAAPSRFTRTRYDGVGAVTFASAEALAAEFASEYYRDVVAPDEPRFTDISTSAVFVGERIDLT
ncbi:EthD domain-containing protein [Agromyces soli]